jgi:hypothetical protein
MDSLQVHIVRSDWADTGRVPSGVVTETAAPLFRGVPGGGEYGSAISANAVMNCAMLGYHLNYACLWRQCSAFISMRRKQTCVTW